MRRWLGYGLLAAMLLGCGRSTEPVQQTRALPHRLIPQSKDVTQGKEVPPNKDAPKKR